MNNTAEITVLGAGSYGTALAISLASNGHKTLLWGHDPKSMQVLADSPVMSVFLLGSVFPIVWPLKPIWAKPWRQVKIS